MRLLEYIEQHGYEQVVACHDPSVGLKAFIAIYDTRLGPALGGVRMWPYKTEEEALTVRATRDALAKLDANPERLLQ